MIFDAENYIAHYGILRRSGRWPWGSTNNVPGSEEESYQRSKTFLDTVRDMRREGMKETEIAAGFELTTTQLRALVSIEKNRVKQADIAQAQRLHDKGWSNVAIGQRMGINESSVRALLAPGAKDRADVLTATSNILKDQVAKKKYVDIGVGAERAPQLGVSQTKLATAVARLQEEGYTVHYIKVRQLGTGKDTTRKVLAGPGVSYSEVFANRDAVQTIEGYSTDGGRTWYGILPPKSISSKRLAINYAEDGGSEADGVIYVRPGVKDVSLGDSRYAQVRIAVDGTHYIKGMAMYKEDLPEGVDLVFNTNKHNTGRKHDALKPLKDDPDNPFGAQISRQIGTKDSDGQVTRLTSVMNIVNEEGDWAEWSRSLSSQMLSKQRPSLAKAQLEMTQERRQQEFDEIMALTNPTVRKKLLETFAESTDAAAVHLDAAALSRRQAHHVLLPVQSIKETEIYAPNYNDGERVVLIRHPHGGIFEIPDLVVNNRNPEAKRLLGNAPDAVGINPKVAQRLSGADFDGDTVIVIPNNDGKVKTAPALEGLKNFDPIAAFPPYDGMRTIDGGTYNAATKSVDYGGRRPSDQKQTQMGVVSNLITDMTVQGASSAELARAVRHSMVVIDSEKHMLNWKQSAIDNGIAQLQAKYQIQESGRAGGASTLLSRAGAEARVPERKQGFRVDPKTGQKIYRETGASYVDKKGKTIQRITKSTRLAETTDARTLLSRDGGTKIEQIYADHSNKLKRLAERARLEALSTEATPYSPSARTAYAHEVASLNAKLNVALKNAPRERQAQALANAVVRQKQQRNPGMDAATLKKISSQALAEMRTRTGAKKTRIEITKSEWDAIQAGAIRKTRLSEILNHADLDQVRHFARPKKQILMTTAKRNRAQSMLASGYMQAEVAAALGVSLTTLKDSLS